LSKFKPNESIKPARNPDYWKPDPPYLDGIACTIVRNAPTAILALGARKFDRTGPGFVPISLLKEIKSQGPDINCEAASCNSRTAIINRAVSPFDNAELRRAIMLTLDRKAFIDIIGEGQGEIGATMQPPPNGV
jgi:peptide/nickel transport system substrate-binding protein